MIDCLLVQGYYWSRVFNFGGSFLRLLWEWQGVSAGHTPGTKRQMIGAGMGRGQTGSGGSGKGQRVSGPGGGDWRQCDWAMLGHVT